jgi:single-strand DNA-binding protein
MVTFSVATSESWRDKATGERKERTEWHRVTVFSEGLVKVAQSYLRKGSRVMVEGPIRSRKWTDREGVEKYQTGIVLDGFDARLILLDPPPLSQKTAASPQGPVNYGEELNDHIPY